MVFKEMNVYRYMFAICPEGDMQNQVKTLKQQLYHEIGWYSSYNSAAHITLHAFDADDIFLSQYEKAIESVANVQKSQALIFDGIKEFEWARTVFVAPDQLSEDWIRSLRKACGKKIRMRKSFEPHMTVGKDIPKGRFQRAKEVFCDAEIHLEFLCNNIALREFNPKHGQYSIIKRFPFGDVSSL